MVFRRLFSRKNQQQDQLAETAHFDSVEEGDQMIIDQLRGLGANLSLPREVPHS